MFRSKDFKTPGFPFAFSGRNQVQRHFPLHIPKKDLIDNLFKIDSYTRHRQPKRPRWNPTFVYGKRQLIQADLIDLSSLAEFNANVKYILACIDTFSRKAWAVPLERKDTDTMLIAFRQLLDEIEVDKNVKYLLSDSGTEFKNGRMYNMIKRRGITHLFAGRHAHHIERFNRTIESLISQYLTENETRRYINKLHLLLRSYNNRYHRIIRCTPNEADKPENRFKVNYALSIYYEKKSRRKKKAQPKYNVGMFVRIKRPKELIRKGYDETFTTRFFVIHAIKTNLPHIMYYIRLPEPKNHVIKKPFYEHELQPYTSDVFKVDKILGYKTVNGQRFKKVKWQGFDEDAATWEPEENIVPIIN